MCDTQEILNRRPNENDGRTALRAIRTAVSVMGEAKGAWSFGGQLTSELGRDKAPAPCPIQITVPTTLAVDQVPRASSASQDAVDLDPDGGCLNSGCCNDRRGSQATLYKTLVPAPARRRAG